MQKVSGPATDHIGTRWVAIGSASSRIRVGGVLCYGSHKPMFRLTSRKSVMSGTHFDRTPSHEGGAYNDVSRTFEKSIVVQDF